MATGEQDGGTNQQPLDYSPQNYESDPQKIRRIRRSAVAAAVLVAVFTLGRMSTSIDFGEALVGRNDPSGDPKVTVADETAAFTKVVDRWNEMVKLNDGYLPSDGYKALFDCKAINAYRELRFYEFASMLPVRLNPDLARNVHWPIFYRECSDLGELWTCFADGTWGRIPKAQPAADDWYRSLRVNGFPVDSWRSDRERSEWVSKNRDRLVWDAASHLYVVSSVPQTRP